MKATCTWHVLKPETTKRNHRNETTETSETGGYKTKTEDLRPKNEDPVKIVLKSLEKGWNMILKRSRNKEQQNLRLCLALTVGIV